MSAQGVWAGLGDSVFLAGVEDRERDPARLITGLVSGVVLGLVAAVCGLLLIMVCYAIFVGDGARGLEGLWDDLRLLRDLQTVTPGLIVLRLVVDTVVDGGSLLVFVAAVASIMRQPLWVYVAAAGRVRWRLFGLAMALSAAAITPVVVAERILNGGGGDLAFLAISPSAFDRIVYCLSALMLIPAAAAEELFFRGWLLRQTGAFLRRPLTLIAATALLFSTAHLDFNPGAFLTRVLMGGAFAYMTLRLGGVEFAAGAHAVNNLMIMLFLQPLSLNSSAAPEEPSAFSLVEAAALMGGYIMITELVVRLPALRRWAGVRTEDISPTRDVSAHFS